MKNTLAVAAALFSCTAFSANWKVLPDEKVKGGSEYAVTVQAGDKKDQIDLLHTFADSVTLQVFRSDKSFAGEITIPKPTRSLDEYQQPRFPDAIKAVKEAFAAAGIEQKEGDALKVSGLEAESVLNHVTAPTYTPTGKQSVATRCRYQLPAEYRQPHFNAAHPELVSNEPPREITSTNCEGTKICFIKGVCEMDVPMEASHHPGKEVVITMQTYNDLLCHGTDKGCTKTADECAADPDVMSSYPKAVNEASSIDSWFKGRGDRNIQPAGRIH